MWTRYTRYTRYESIRIHLIPFTLSKLIPGHILFISLTWLNGTREDQWTSAEKAQLLSQCVGLRGNRSDLTVGSCRA